MARKTAAAKAAEEKAEADAQTAEATSTDTDTSGEGGGDASGESGGESDSSTEEHVPTIPEVGTDTDLAPLDSSTPGGVGDPTLADGVIQTPQIESRTAVPGGPLEPPATPTAVKVGTIEQTHMTPGALGAALVDEGDYLIDAATGEAPDVDSMFVNEYGSVYVCQVRLMEDVSLAGGSVSRRLVMPAGQRVSAETAQKFQSLARAQAEARAQDESDES